MYVVDHAAVELGRVELVWLKHVNLIRNRFCVLKLFFEVLSKMLVQKNKILNTYSR